MRSEGSLVGSSRDDGLLTTIVRQDPLWVRFSLSESDYARLRSGRGEKSRVVANDVAGRLNFTGSRVDPQLGTVQLRAEFPNPDSRLLPGQYLALSLEIDQTDSILVPQSAVQQGDRVMVSWETTSELDNLGFNLYRGTSAAGPLGQLNETLIPSQAPGSTGGFVYTWDDRAELPAEVTAASAMPTLAESETPSYEVHIQPIIKRYCISCHREGKTNNNYIMDTYENVINGGDNAPNLIAGDLTCNTIRMLNREDLGDIGSAMPPTKALKAELVDVWVRWVLAGMPETAEDAAAAPSIAP